MGLGGLLALTCLLLSAVGQTAGIPSEAGRPLVRSFVPREFGADSQNWALVQDPRGLVYAANNYGVLEYDGVRWRLLHTRDNTSIRSLAMSAQGTVFVGAQNEFGYLAPDDHGQMRYVSLDDRLPPSEREFGNIWSITVCSQGVYFVSSEHLFAWDGTRLRHWKAPTSFFMGYVIRDHFLVLDKGKGMLERVGDSFQLMPGGARFAGKKPRFMVPWTDAGKDVILWGSRDEGLMLFDGETFRKGPTRADGYLKKNILHSGIRLADGSLAMATSQGGVVILAQDQMRLLNKEEGILNQTAYCLLEDPRSGLWLGGSKAIDLLGWPPTLSRFDESDGLSGAVLDIRRHAGTLFATTNRGLFYLSQKSASTGRRGFLPVADIKGQCWDMLSLGPSLLVANYDGIYEVVNARARKVLGSTGHTTCFLPSPHDSNRIFVGTVAGLFSLRRTHASAPWKDEGRVADIHEDIRTLAMGSDGHLWVGCDAPIVLKVSLPAGSAPGQPTVERLGPKESLPQNSWNFTATMGGQAVVYSPSGIFRFDAHTRRFQRDPRTAALGLGPELPLFRIAEGPDGDLWLGCQAEGTTLRRAVPGADDMYRWVGASVTCSDAPLFVLRPEVDGTLWFGGVDGVFRRGPTPREATVVPPPVLIRHVLKWGGMPVSPGQEGAVPRIPYADNTLRFEYALPQLGPTSHPRYQIQLVGLDRGWSAWSTEPYRNYTNLKAGRYQFRVRASQGEGDTPTEAVFTFHVLQPWFRTWWAFGLYILGATLAMGAAHQARIRILKRRNEELESRVTEATQALTEQASELEWMNHELRDLNEQKNHFLGIVSHDLKSPINGIVMAAETLRTAQDAQLISRTAQSIEEDGLAMGALIDRFLNVTALESGRIAVQPIKLDARKVLQEALLRHGPRAATKGLPLTLETGEEPLWAQTDPFLLGEVLDNLISNAIKFSRPGEPIHLRAQGFGHRICVSVEDHGPGLQPEDHRKLFNRFARLSAKPTGGETSVGLGLSIAHQLVMAMGGRLWADEARGRGAAFRIDLPGYPEAPVGE